MTDHLSIVQSVISGVLTGGTAAGTTFLSVFKDIKKRIGELEARVGNEKTEPKTGFYLSFELLSENVRRMRREIDGWRDDPPDWAVRVSRRSSVTMERDAEIEQRVEQRLKAFTQTIRHMEERLEEREHEIDNLKRTLPAKKGVAVDFITREEYEEDSKRRALEMIKVRENLASANTWLRGVMTTIGAIDSEPVVPPPLPPKLPTIKKR